MVKQYAFTIRGLFTSRLYTVSDYKDQFNKLPSTIQVSLLRFELDSHKRLHAHGVFTVIKSLPNLKSYFGRGWYIHTSANPGKKWFNYIEKDSLVSPAELEYQQSLHHYRTAGYLFQD